MVIDSTDRERLAVTREELFELLQHEDLSKACLLVYANKQVNAVMDGFRDQNNLLIDFNLFYIKDLKGAMSAAEISRQLDLTSIKKHQWHIQSCCALTGDG